MRKSFFKLIYFFLNVKKTTTHSLSYHEYKKLFLEDKEKLKEAYEKIWDCRKFEIELYWKRANYFWALLVPTFAAYFAIINSNSYALQTNHSHLLIVIEIGIIVSFRWALINKGSKTWQQHWETHLEILEDAITGPLYKTVQSTSTFSVTKVNEIISWFFCLIWFVLAYKFCEDEKLNISLTKIDKPLTCSSILTMVVLMIMFWGYGRTRLDDKEVKFFVQEIKFN